MAEKEYTVHFPVYAEYSVRVIADPDDYEDEEELADALLDKGNENMPSGPCAQCSGWGQSWYLDCDNSSSEAQYIDDEQGNNIWGDPDKKLGW